VKHSIVLSALALGMVGCVMVPPQFNAQTQADGSRVFTYKVHLTSSHPQGPNKVEEITSTYVTRFAPAGFCNNGWEITKQSEVDKVLEVEGRCK
jgi:hypothetical protein